jgi:uncharacterized membrane protein YqjE
MVNPELKSKGGILPKDSEGHSPGEVLREISTSAKDLVQSEVHLVQAEIKESAANLGRHSAQAAIFGALLSLSVLPFLAFLVVGLAEILGGNFWLSSLIVALVCAVVGGSMTYRAYKKIKQQDLMLPHTRDALQYGKDTVTEKAQDVKETATGKVQDIKETTKRRAS